MNTEYQSNPKNLIHLTLNTGDLRNSPRAEVNSEVVDGLAPLVTRNGAPLFQLPWDINIRIDAANHSAVFVVKKGLHRIVTCVVAFGSEDEYAWRTALYNYRSDFESLRAIGIPAAGKPVSNPWLTVQLHVGMARLPIEEILMLGDFERCLAWAIIERHRGA